LHDLTFVQPDSLLIQENEVCHFCSLRIDQDLHETGTMLSLSVLPCAGPK